MSLYRKYRSRNFSEIIGQGHVTSILLQAVKTNNISHSYLFNGPRGTGKTSMARILAKAVNCQNSDDGEPCNECTFCKSINDSKLLDLIEIDAASNRGIDQIRDLRDKVNFSPVSARYKVYIIDEVHMLTKEAFNALLKTLEEPPSYCIFILATTEIHKVPDTIISRCQRFDFKLGALKSIASKLRLIAEKENFKVTDGALAMISLKAKGSYRDAETLMDKIISDDKLAGDSEISENDVREKLGYIDAEIMDAFMNALEIKSLLGAIQVIEDVYADGRDINQFISQVIEISRDCLNKLIRNELNPYKFNLSEYMQLIKIFNQARLEAKDAVLPQLPIELATIDFLEKMGAKVGQGTSIKIPSIVIDMANAVTGKPKAEKPEYMPRNESKPNSDINLSDKDIQNKWKQFINDIKPFNHNLSAFLMLARFNKIDGDEIILEVPYIFHKKKIEQKRSREILSGVGNKTWGVDLIFNCEVNKDIAIERREKEGDMLGTIREVFGDTLIEE